MWIMLGAAAAWGQSEPLSSNASIGDFDNDGVEDAAVGVAGRCGSIDVWLSSVVGDIGGETLKDPAVRAKLGPSARVEPTTCSADFGSNLATAFREDVPPEVEFAFDHSLDVDQVTAFDDTACLLVASYLQPGDVVSVVTTAGSSLLREVPVTGPDDASVIDACRMLGSREANIKEGAVGGYMIASTRDVEAWSHEGGKDWGCRDCGFTNAATLGLHPLDGFSITSPDSGVALTGIEDPEGQVHPVTVVGHGLEATADGGTVRGEGLVGWELRFLRAGVAFGVEIDGFERRVDWREGHRIDTYDLAGDGASCGHATSVVFTPNERYDAQAKTVRAAPGQVTVACLGQAVAKLKFMGYDPNDGYGSTSVERQATLKMLTADYCGTGTSFTKTGQPLDWQDAGGGFTPTGRDDIEARWNDQGALCLNQPRRPEVSRDEVVRACEIDRCDGNAADLSGAVWATYHVPGAVQR